MPIVPSFRPVRTNPQEKSKGGALASSSGMGALHGTRSSGFDVGDRESHPSSPRKLRPLIEPVEDTPSPEDRRRLV